MFKLFILQIIISIAHAKAAQQCTYEDLTKNCQFFSELSGNDILTFDDGWELPACSLASVSEATRIKSDNEKKAVLVKIAIILEKAKTKIIESTFYQYLNGNLDIKSLISTDETVEMHLPIGVHWKEQQKKIISRQELEKLWGELIGSDQIEPLKSALRELDHTVELALNLEYRGDQYQAEDISRRESEILNGAKECLSQALILNGRDRKDLSKEEANLLMRMESIQASKGHDSVKLDCQPGYSAYNDEESAEVGLPPGQMFLPTQSLFRSMAHELAHSIDLCRIAKPWNISNSTKTLSELNPNASTLGIASTDLGKTSIQPIPFDKHPLLSVNDCLINDPSKAFSQVHEGISPMSSPEAACTQNKQNEAFCDWAASLAVAENERTKCFDKMAFKYTPPRLTEKSKQSIGKKIKVPKGWAPAMHLLDKACSGNNDSESHPLDKDRINKIFLRNPEIQKLLGCAPTKDLACENPLSNQKNNTNRNSSKTSN